jgi:cell division septation protein DedD
MGVITMRRFLSVFFFAVLVSHLPAQAGLGDYSMQGAASQEMTQQGLVGAHASLPINSRVKITNPQNGREAEITIIERIDPSLNRIIDLSSTTMSALQLKAGEQVVVTVNAPPRPVTQTSYQPEPIIDLTEPFIITQDRRPSANEPSGNEQTNTPAVSGQEPRVKESGQESQVLSAGQSNDPYYPEFTLDDPAAMSAYFSGANSGDPEFLAWLMVMTIEAREAREARAARDARESRELREIREEREIREIRAAREAREARELREIREAREERERREAARSAANASANASANAAANSVSNAAENSQVSTPQTNNQPQINYRPAINLPPTNRQNNDRNRPLNLNTLSPISAVQQKDEDPSSALRVSSNQSRAIQQPAQRQEQLEPVKPEALQIIPGLPDRFSGKSYKLQIGAYSSKDTANETVALLKKAGFNAEVEFSGVIYRVFAAGIPSSDVYSASVRLGSLGFAQIWVKE